VTFHAVLFDAGDTLIRLCAEAGALLLAAAKPLGVAIDPNAAAEVWQRVLACASTPDELARGRDLSPERHRAVWTELYMRCGTDELAPGLGEALYRVTIDPNSWETFPDTVPTLRALRRRGVPVGVVSDTGFDLRPVLDNLDLRHLIDAVVLSCDHGACKPDLRLFRIACDALDVEPAATLMVGDNPLTDGAAAAAGMCVLLLPPPSVATQPRGLSHVLSLVYGAESP
jgi:putative hydrolase of the HAD superfamily